MMNERARRMIEAYLPSPPDPALMKGEYYFRRDTTRGCLIIKVHPLDILPMKGGVEYGIYQVKGNRLARVDARADGDRFRGVRMGQLYDNREDCLNGAHDWYDNWEDLRKLQREG